MQEARCVLEILLKVTSGQEAQLVYVGRWHWDGRVGALAEARSRQGSTGPSVQREDTSSPMECNSDQVPVEHSTACAIEFAFLCGRSEVGILALVEHEEEVTKRRKRVADIVERA